jgi:hypothetical protein
MTLVAAMINVAVTGVYVSTAADGIRMHVWRDSDLAALQKQLDETDLPPYVMSALEFEAATHGHLIDTKSGAQIADLMHPNKNQTPMEKAKDGMRWFLTFVPRGWLYQNAALSGRLLIATMDGFDPAVRLVYPVKTQAAWKMTDDALKEAGPLTVLARVMIPNFSRALQTMAMNQTYVNEASIACGLERYRLAHGNYPETLAALTPSYAGKIPNDIVGGGPLIYQATNGTFTIGSVGWNTNSVVSAGAPVGWSWPYAQ